MSKAMLICLRAPLRPRAYTHSATHSALIRKERVNDCRTCRTLVILAAISTHAVSSAREGAEEATGESPTSKARGISDFRPAEHAPEDVTEQDIRNKPAMDTSERLHNRRERLRKTPTTTLTKTTIRIEMILPLRVTMP